MASKWVLVDGRYRRVVRGKTGDVYGLITQDGDRYRWRASAYVGWTYGWSRSLDGAKRSCGVAMRVLLKWIDATEEAQQ